MRPSRTCKWFPLCPIKRYHELGVIDSAWVERYCRGDWERCVRYALEERGESHPDWMLPDGTVDKRLARY